jgi:hypothetical protein
MDVAFVFACLFSLLLIYTHNGHVKDLREYRDFWHERYLEEEKASTRYRRAILQARDPTQVCRYCRTLIEGDPWGSPCRACEVDKTNSN